MDRGRAPEAPFLSNEPGSGEFQQEEGEGASFRGNLAGLLLTAHAPVSDHTTMHRQPALSRLSGVRKGGQKIGMGLRWGIWEEL